MGFNNYNHSNNEPTNYDFIPFIKPEVFKPASKEQFSGYIEVELIAVDKLFIGSGMSHFDGTTISDTTLQEDGKLIIPGSSLKGAIRHISRAVSPSCIPDVKKYEVEDGYFKQCKKDDCCIVCDMFGMMSKASKIRFTDLVSENGKTVKVKVSQQHGPNKNTKKYKDGQKYIGYKFYYTDCEKRNIQKIDNIEAVPEKTSFIGKIFFKELYEKELQLLMFSLTFSGLISIKLGKYKADGFGTCNIFCRKLMINGKEENISKARDYAIAHEEYVDKIAVGQIDDLSDILSRQK